MVESLVSTWYYGVSLLLGLIAIGALVKSVVSGTIQKVYRSIKKIDNVDDNVDEMREEVSELKESSENLTDGVVALAKAQQDKDTTVDLDGLKSRLDRHPSEVDLLSESTTQKRFRGDDSVQDD